MVRRTQPADALRPPPRANPDLKRISPQEMIPEEINMNSPRVYGEKDEGFVYTPVFKHFHADQWQIMPICSELHRILRS
jgi:hypothetical protein